MNKNLKRKKLIFIFVLSFFLSFFIQAKAKPKPLTVFEELENGCECMKVFCAERLKIYLSNDDVLEFNSAIAIFRENSQKSNSVFVFTKRSNSIYLSDSFTRFEIKNLKKEKEADCSVRVYYLPLGCECNF